MLKTKIKLRTPKLGSNKRKEEKKLIQKCDELVSKIVRLRDGRCVCCGSRENLQCGHLIKRGRMSTRFDLVNCNCQCSRCNYKHNHYPEYYTDWFVLTYGVDKYHELFRRSWQTKDWTLTELTELKEELQQKLDELLKSKVESE